MGTYAQLRNNIKSLLDEITRIQEKHARPTFKFNGYPAAFVVPSGNENDFQSQYENERVYAFKIWVFTEYHQSTGATAYQELMECVEEIINKFDEQENPTTANREMDNDLGAGVTLLSVMAVPGRFALDEEENLLGAEVTIRCKVLVDLTLLT